MRCHSPIPEEKLFQYSGPDWMLLLLSHCSPEQRDLVKLTLWQAWRVHNNLTHDSGAFDVQSSIHSLLSITNAFKIANFGNIEAGNKGKQKMWEPGRKANDGAGNTAVKEKWVPPTNGWMKINVDGSFDEHETIRDKYD